MSLDQTHWQSRLDALAAKHGIVGASLAIAKGDVTLVAATGVLNRRTGVRATPDALFQVGSITKVWTATLLMQLVDEGLLDFDAPIVRYLPHFRIADDAITATVTARQLLSHTSGIDGDLMTDTGRGDDAIDKYVSAMASLTRVIPPGSTMSYCNAGYSLLGKLVAQLRGKTWELVLRERLLKPLGLDSAGTLPEEAILHAAAVGHVVPPGATAPIVTPAWDMPRGAAPAGRLHSTAAHQLAFARLHLAGGVAPDGTRLLSEASVVAMQKPHVAIPDRWSLGDHWGLGWILAQWGDQPVYGHDGATLGQAACLRILPKAGVVICLLMNGGRGPVQLFRELAGEIAPALAGVSPPTLPTPTPGLRVDPRRYVGTYSRVGCDVTVAEQDDGLAFTLQFTGDMARLLTPTPETGALVPHSEEVFLATLPSRPEPVPVVLFERDGTRYCHFSGRTAPKRVD
ncbi:MAG TPA: serine hydrolase [Nevskiaceae bacterium]|nr:serine hydrolase [Nevskiaceae bacterium]